MDSVAEVWKDVKGCEGHFQVSNIGRVRSLDRLVPHSRGGMRRAKGIILTPIKRIYPTVHLPGQRPALVHVLVAEAFLGPKPPKYEVNHIDGNKHNPRLDNLEYVTRKQNIAHAFKTGLCDHRGEKNGASTISQDTARRAYALVMETGLTPKQAADTLGISINIVRSIMNGKRWSHLNLGPIRKRRSPVTITAEQMVELRRLHNLGRSSRSLARQFGISSTYARNIAIGYRNK